MLVVEYQLMLLCVCFVIFFFFKQKTAYEMRISDWSSDVCSSDLVAVLRRIPVRLLADQQDRHLAFAPESDVERHAGDHRPHAVDDLGRDTGQVDDRDRLAVRRPPAATRPDPTPVVAPYDALRETEWKAPVSLQNGHAVLKP